MNILPEFLTSMEYKKYKQALGHPAAVELFVNLGCQIEGITRRNKKDTGHLGIHTPDDLHLMAGADAYPQIEAASLEDSLLSSGLMTKDEDGYRLISWEEQNANLIATRQNGRKGGRKKNSTESNPTELNDTESNETKNKINKPNLIEGNQTEETEPNKTERNETQRNVTGGLPQGEPWGNRGFTGKSVDEVSEDFLREKHSAYKLPSDSCYADDHSF
ncbi:MAG: hypothetical protein ACON46_02240 [Coraliomargaritaceae bacterium]